LPGARFAARLPARGWEATDDALRLEARGRDNSDPDLGELEEADEADAVGLWVRSRADRDFERGSGGFDMGLNAKRDREPCSSTARRDRARELRAGSAVDLSIAEVKRDAMRTARA
jgi:hypothetical protein